MRIFLAVVIDLIDFVFSHFNFAESKKTDNDEIETSGPPITDFQTTAKPVLQDMQKSSAAVGVLESAEIAYIAVSTARVMEQPRWVFDSVVAHLEYGDAVKVYGYEGRFVQIYYKEKYGWVLKDEVTFNQTDIFPNLQEGKVYLAADTETRKLRQVIKDEYFAADLYLPLQAVEFVTFTLRQHGVVIAWPILCPRVAGRWQIILKGVRGVFIAITPKTGSVMEYYTQAGLGQVLYVKSVLPDETIVVCGVGVNAEGMYTENELSRAAWQELGAVFIQFT